MSEILRGGNPGRCFFIRRAANIEKGVFSFMDSLVGPGTGMTRAFLRRESPGTGMTRAFLRRESPVGVVGFC